MTVEKNRNIKAAQEQIAEKLMTDGQVEGLLSDHIIGQFVDSEIEINPDDIWVDFPNMAFLFKNLYASFSGEQDGTGIDNNLTVKGEGKFKWSGGKVTEIYELKIKDNPDDNITPKYDRD